MKKIFTIAAILTLAISINAYAGWDFKTSTVATNPYAGGGSTNGASDYTWNDGAKTGGGSQGEAENFGQAAAGSFFRKPTTYAIGEADSNGFTKSGAFAADFGTTSVAGAGTFTNVNVAAGGESGFDKGVGEAYNKSKGHVDGSVFQNNYVNEIGYYGGTFAQGRNTSGASFDGNAFDSDFDASLFKGKANSEIRMSGVAGTAGASIATVDPYGKHQDATALTGNASIAGLCGADCGQTDVWGNGGVNVGANVQGYNSGAYAGGTSDFSYDGKTFGAGAAGMDAKANRGNSNFSSSAAGFAISIAE
jgi:hypothetical protein